MLRNAMEDFIEMQNIAKFKMLLATEDNPDKRQILMRLLADEEAKHAAHLLGAYDEGAHDGQKGCNANMAS